MIFLIKASIIIIFFLAFYKLFLEKESFFKANRIYLLLGLTLACILPFVVLPKIADHQGYVEDLLINSVVLQEDRGVRPADRESNVDIFTATEVDRTDEPATEITKDDKQLSTKEYSDEAMLPMIKSSSSVRDKTRGIGFYLFWIYIFGVVILLINMLVQILSLVLRVLRNHDKIKDEDHTIVNMEGEVEPCSFFNYIFINPGSYDFETYEQIIAHEKIHVQKMHTLDLLLAEFAVVLLWFNPFVWLMRQEVEKNIEYETDETLVSQAQEVKKEYQMNLLKIACRTSPLAITTNYNQSLIKKRILRMNAKRSNKFSYWKVRFYLAFCICNHAIA